MAHTTIFGVLKKEHREVDELFQEIIEECQDGVANMEKVQLMRQALEAHLRFEEKAIYPKAEKEEAERLGDQVDESYDEHAEVKALLQKINKSMSASELGKLCKEIAKNVKHHVEEEESILFPVLEKEWPSEVRHSLTDEYQQFKQTVAG